MSRPPDNVAPRADCYVWNGITIRRAATTATTRTESVSVPHGGRDLK